MKSWIPLRGGTMIRLSVWYSSLRTAVRDASVSGVEHMRLAQREQSDQTDKTDQTDQTDQTDKTDKIDKTDQTDQTDNLDDRCKSSPTTNQSQILT
jgi:hypothetical protein